MSAAPARKPFAPVEADTEPIRVFPKYALAHLIHALLAIVGSVLAVSVPIAGALLVLLALVSASLDLTGAWTSWGVRRGG